MPNFCFLAPAAPASKADASVNAVWRAKAEEWQSGAIFGLKLSRRGAGRRNLITIGETMIQIVISHAAFDAIAATTLFGSEGPSLLGLHRLRGGAGAGRHRGRAKRPS
jgi:hypothetical protein